MGTLDGVRLAINENGDGIVAHDVCWFIHNYVVLLWFRVYDYQLN